MSLINLKNISKIYGEGESEFKALDNINLEINPGEMIAIMGPSGAGKSTLLNILGCMDKPSYGKYILGDAIVTNLKSTDLAKIRNKYIGFVFQYFALIKEYSVLENVQLPLNLRKVSKEEKKKISLKFLEKLKIKDQYKKKPSQLSGGQQQRVAIARALVADCPIILADEPTGALDKKTSKEIINILKDINKDGKTVIIVTHNEEVANNCMRKIIIEDGKIVKDTSILNIAKY